MNRTSRKVLGFGLLLILLNSLAMAQGPGKYQYSVNLNEVKNDQLTIQLTVPKVTKSEIVFYMPKIIPGTYGNADYGKFVHNLKAYDKAGKEIPVKSLDENSWQIRNATKLNRIVYDVEDTWESAIEHNIYDMAGTNIEENKNFVLNTPGFFGYLDGMTKVPFEVTVTKPERLYASTPLIATRSDKTTDVFTLEDADHLYDSPIMYSVPDTTTIRLGATQVLISVYSPRKLVTSAAMAESLRTMLEATQNYLGGKLPVKKYAFIYYFNGEQPPLKKTGALEHNYSSFYALPEYPFENLAPILLDISAHEFFHVVTPLTISSREVKEFNFNKPVLSQHLWLYEGSTEYASDHVQVTKGLITPEDFLGKLAEKIKNSQESFNDTLPFTELSKHSADKHADQYLNVYEKGALISASLDLYLLHLSNGNYGLKDLKHDLGIKYGKDKYFDDKKLFDDITEMTFPQVRDFFTKYVEGPQAIPYNEFFGLAGVQYKITHTPSLGSVQLGGGQNGKLIVAGTDNLNTLGKQLGYKAGDEFVSVNGSPISIANATEILDKYKATAKAGDDVVVVVRRKSDSGATEDVTLKGKVITIEVKALELNPTPTPQQLQVRNAWLGTGSAEAEPTPVPAADPKDVAEIDSIVKALYEVISGPAGPRNWDRFRSLFYKGATMGAVVKASQAREYKKFTPEEYVKMNDPHFKQVAFYEKEVGREVDTFGNIAHVFSAYEYTLEMPEPVKQRGINSIELVKEAGRWHILSLTWDEESPENPLPASYLFSAPATEKKKKRK